MVLPIACMRMLPFAIRDRRMGVVLPEEEENGLVSVLELLGVVLELLGSLELLLCVVLELLGSLELLLGVVLELLGSLEVLLGVVLELLGSLELLLGVTLELLGTSEAEIIVRFVPLTANAHSALLSAKFGRKELPFFTAIISAAYESKSRV
jgi:hypothetical protein